MKIYELFLIAIGLSMDAFAVSICKGLNMKKINYKDAFIISLFFGLFQAIMPIIGYAIGLRFEKYIKSFDHWIAFILLFIIGFNMIREALKEEDDELGTKGTTKSIQLKELSILAIATSIDALAVGISFAFLGVSILKSASLIGIVTFILSFIGVIMGNKFGAKYKEKAAIAGGLVLILIGLKILLEHLGILIL